MVERRSVMISSTARDLPDHREQVRIACERAGFAPHDMMEHLAALDTDAIEASLNMVENADVYVGIFAYRYGSVPNDHKISITEMEYDHAVKLNKPRLIFFVHEDHPVTGKDVETGPGAAKLQALKDRIGSARVAAFFKSPEDLRAHVVEALNTLARGLRKGDAKAASERALAELHRRTSIPEPPQAYIAHPYTLLQTRELVGRQTELNLLTDWVTNPESAAYSAPVLAVVAIGGMGKSAYTWKWFNQIAPSEMKSLAGRMWWSFYESDATFENFVNRALSYVSGIHESEVRGLSWQEREAILLQCLDEKPYLFVLDGLERILIAYNCMDAARLADDELDQATANHVAGAHGLPESAAQSFVGEHRLRQTTDPRAGSFLRKLAQTKASRFLITTRLYPNELQLPTRAARPGCAAYFLRGLSNDDALALWRGLGSSGSRSELIPIFNSVQNHPMLVQALASEVANYRKAPGDFEAWRADHPQFNPTALPMVQSRTHILQFALEGLSKEHREVLHTIVGFRMPAPYATLEALLTGPGKLFAGIQMLDIALTALEDRGLIGWDREANRYDAHPIVRGVVWQCTEQKNKEAVLVALNQHFESIAVPDWQDVNSVDDLTPAIERYHSLVELGRFDDAYWFFSNRLEQATLYKLSAHRERIAWLEGLFPNGATGDTPLSTSTLRNLALGSLAISYNITGHPAKASQVHELTIDPDAPDREEHVRLSNLAITFLDSGSLAKSWIASLKAVASSRNENDEESECLLLRELARLERIRGRYDFSLLIMQRSIYLGEKVGMESSAVLYAYCAELYLDVGDHAAARRASDLAWDDAERFRFERDFIRAALLQGRAALGAGNLAHANERLHHALVRARGSNVVDFELPILVAIGELELKQSRPQAAAALLDEAWEGIERGPYPIVGADAYLVLAEAQLAMGNTPGSIQAANDAFAAAWCDGPPFAYAFGLAQARAHLARLGAQEPNLPPFDADRFGPWPDVEINLEDEYWVDPDRVGRGPGRE